MNIKSVLNYTKNDKKIFYLLFFVIMIIYIFFTFKSAILSGRIPTKDEAFNWDIARHFSISQIICLMRTQGHFLLWFLVIKPFTLFKSLYPTPMLVVNWLFITGAVILLWLKAPFNIFTKIAITFSFPFFRLYPIVARCYSIGIFFLFLSMCLYKKRLDRPYLYLCSLVLCANTNIIMCVTSSILGIFFLYDLIKSKAPQKVINIVILVASLNVILWGIQFWNVEVPNYVHSHRPYELLKFLNLSTKLNTFEFITCNLLRCAILIWFIYIFKSKKTFFVLLSVTVFYLILFTKIYTVTQIQHIWLSYTIIILSYWLFKKENCKNDILEILLFVFSFYFIFMTMKTPHGFIYKGLENEKNINLFIGKTEPHPSPNPYLAKNNIRIYDIGGNYIYSYDYVKLIYSKNKNITKNIDKIAKIANVGDIFILGSNSKNYLRGEKSIIYLKKEQSIYYRIIKIENY